MPETGLVGLDQIRLALMGSVTRSVHSSGGVHELPPNRVSYN